MEYYTLGESVDNDECKGAQECRTRSQDNCRFVRAAKKQFRWLLKVEEEKVSERTTGTLEALISHASRRNGYNILTRATILSHSDGMDWSVEYQNDGKSRMEHVNIMQEI